MRAVTWAGYGRQDATLPSNPDGCRCVL